MVEFEVNWDYVVFVGGIDGYVMIRFKFGDYGGWFELVVFEYIYFEVIRGYDNFVEIVCIFGVVVEFVFDRRSFESDFRFVFKDILNFGVSVKGSDEGIFVEGIGVVVVKFVGMGFVVVVVD